MIVVNFGLWIKTSCECPQRAIKRLDVAKGEYVVHYEYLPEQGQEAYLDGFYTMDAAEADAEFFRRRRCLENASVWSCANLIGWKKEQNNG